MNRTLVAACSVVLCATCAAPAGELGPATAETPASAAPMVAVDSASSPTATVALGSTSTSSRPVAATEEEERENAGCRFRESTNVMTKCVLGEKRLGDWDPRAADLASALEQAAGQCYCVKGLDAIARRCMTQVGSGNVELMIGENQDATDCTVSIRTAAWGRRKFVQLRADIRDLSTIYGTIGIYEQEGTAAKEYFVGFNTVGDPRLVGPGEEGVSKRMHADWPKLPVNLREWMGP